MTAGRRGQGIILEVQGEGSWSQQEGKHHIGGRNRNLSAVKRNRWEGQGSEKNYSSSMLLKSTMEGRRFMGNTIRLTVLIVVIETTFASFLQRPGATDQVNDLLRNM